MITETEMYWLTRLTSLKDGVVGFGLGAIMLFSALGFVALVGWLMEDSETGKKWFKISIPGFILGMLIALSNVFIPTTKEMCAIKAVPLIVNNEQVQEIPSKVVDLADEWLDELKPSKENENED